MVETEKIFFYFNTAKDDFYSFFIFARFFYIYIYCRKCNAEFNKLIQTVGHCVRYFEKGC